MDAGTLITDAIASLSTELASVATPALALGGTVMALGIGWRFAKRFVRG
ncbi:MAG TPA: hypothetical protein VHM23_10710 [Actinomycetota bacterium]|jgi:hypothetical protein|nr:hypothetical protein [Actinomycetota bacterium]